MTRISPHFSLQEFTDSQTAARKGIANKPSPSALANLNRLADTMEKVRSILGDRAIIISSGYRSPKLNEAVGGAKTSMHTQGLAADFTCPDFGSPITICLELEPHMIELQIDQLIHEFGTWVHLGLAPAKKDARHMKLTIDRRGTRQGFARA